jgi:hypothetical protein
MVPRVVVEQAGTATKNSPAPVPDSKAIRALTLQASSHASVQTAASLDMISNIRASARRAAVSAYIQSNARCEGPIAVRCLQSSDGGPVDVEHARVRCDGSSTDAVFTALSVAPQLLFTLTERSAEMAMKALVHLELRAAETPLRIGDAFRLETDAGRRSAIVINHVLSRAQCRDFPETVLVDGVKYPVFYVGFLDDEECELRWWEGLRPLVERTHALELLPVTTIDR